MTFVSFSWASEDLRFIERESKRLISHGRTIVNPFPESIVSTRCANDSGQTVYLGFIGPAQFRVFELNMEGPHSHRDVSPLI